MATVLIDTRYEFFEYFAQREQRFRVGFYRNYGELFNDTKNNIGELYSNSCKCGQLF